MSDSRLLDMLSPVWRRTQLARDFANAVGRRFDYWRTVIGAVPSYFDSEGAPSDWLDWLMHVVGLFENRGLTDRRKRNLIDKSGEIWRKKGTAEGIKLYLRALVGIDGEVVNDNDTAFIAGISKAGDVCGPGTLAHKYTLKRPSSTSVSDSELRDLLLPVVPKNRQYRVCDLNGNNCSSYEYPGA